VIVRRERTLEAPPTAVWGVVSDPAHLPRWWPGVLRVEEVEPHAWTNVLGSSKGKLVRADYTLIEREPERRVAWRHEVAESPFERILNDSRTEIELAPTEGGTAVTIAIDHDARGWAKLAPFQLRAATGKQIDEALEGLARLLEEEPE
jgi:uncharacterized protein YndB with AHSA1/START domain